ncbi:aldose epimerase family protein [Planctomycetota bacterium]
MKRTANIFIVISIVACSICFAESPGLGSSITQIHWGTYEGRPVTLFTLTNARGMQVKITNFGGIITSILAPDSNGVFEDVVLGFDNLQQYVDGHPCFGATIGRYANRIRNARFAIDGKTYHLAANDGKHCIHGGTRGFDKQLWEAEAIPTARGPAVRLRYLSPDGEEGFPGTLDTVVTYTLCEDNALHCRFEATTDKPTHVSLTQHSYFNLNGCRSTIHDHRIKLAASRYTEIDEDIVPTGKIGSVRGKEWDCTQFTRMGDHFDKLNYNGYHFNYIFDKPLGQLAGVIDVVHPGSGRTLQVSTTQPGVQFYSGNSIADDYVGKDNIHYGPHMGFCLETQHFPDTPNHSHFPPTLLRPGEKYDHEVIYTFGTLPKAVVSQDFPKFFVFRGEMGRKTNATYRTWSQNLNPIRGAYGEMPRNQ